MKNSIHLSVAIETKIQKSWLFIIFNSANKNKMKPTEIKSEAKAISI